jgi:phage shock protein PspC (stress-responsive transcriptional regulator)
MRVEEARALVVTLVRVAVTITVLAPAFGVGLVAFIAARA